MKLEILVTMISILYSLHGTYCMSKSILSLEPKEVLKSHPSYSGVRHSLEEITTIINSRVETLKGLIFICIGVVFQVGGLFLNETWKAILMDVSYASVVIVALLILNAKIEQFFKNATKIKVLETNKYYVREKINSIDNKVNGGVVDTLEIVQMAEYYFGLNREEDEGFTKYLNRIADFIGAKRLY